VCGAIPHLSDEVSDVVAKNGIPEGRLNQVRERNEGRGSESADARDEAFNLGRLLFVFVGEESAEDGGGDAAADDNDRVHDGVFALLLRVPRVEECRGEETECVAAEETEKASDYQVDEASVLS
jgi:hypothetical protein